MCFVSSYYAALCQRININQEDMADYRFIEKYAWGQLVPAKQAGFPVLEIAPTLFLIHCDCSFTDEQLTTLVSF